MKVFTKEDLQWVVVVLNGMLKEEGLDTGCLRSVDGDVPITIVIGRGKYAEDLEKFVMATTKNRRYTHMTDKPEPSKS